MERGDGRRRHAGGSSLTGGAAAAVDFDTDEAVELRATLQERLQSAVTDRRDTQTTFEWLDGDVASAASEETENWSQARSSRAKPTSGPTTLESRPTALNRPTILKNRQTTLMATVSLRRRFRTTAWFGPTSPGVTETTPIRLSESTPASTRWIGSHRTPTSDTRKTRARSRII